MLKFAAFFRKHPELSHAEFQRYWLGVHAGVVLRLPGLMRYVQSHPLPGTLQAASPFHGMAEVWLADDADLSRDPADPYWTEVAEDEARFIDPASLTVLPVDERVLKQGEWPRPGIKIVRTLKHMNGKVPPVALMPTVGRYARNTARGEGGFCGGYDTTWFANPAAAHGTAATMKDAASMDVMITGEHVIKA